MRTRLGHAALLSALVFLTACKNSSTISLESNIRKVATKSSPFVQVNQGGKALLVESGKTATTGVHGWATVTNVGAPTLSDSGGNKVYLNRAQALAH